MQIHLAFCINPRTRTIYLSTLTTPRTCAPCGESYVLLEPDGPSFTMTRPDEIFITGVCNATDVLAAQLAETFQNHYTRHVPVKGVILGTPAEMVAEIEDELIKCVQSEEYLWSEVAQQLTSTPCTNTTTSAAAPPTATHDEPAA